MDFEVKTNTSVNAVVDSITTISVEQTILADSGANHSKTTNTSDITEVSPVLSIDSNKESTVEVGVSAIANTVDLLTDCFPYNILDRWQKYTFDMQTNVHEFNIELPKR
ncbi:hypothetical protein NVP1161O_029 [Vibrio phage 1.161.O._10N.261.48.C5]|nr:hypothetical protein NVP1161O_029 [Vibrio phage 1.161.O._10N.261.48.C5]